MARSQWRTHADRVIAQVLKGLPADASDAEKRKAVEAAYPFGERRMLPYRHWRAAVRAALNLQPKPRGYGVSLTLCAFADGQPFLRVECGWCDGKVSGGCLACLPLWEKLRAAVKHPEWKRFRAVARAGDPPPREVVRDWLLDRGVEAELPAKR